MDPHRDVVLTRAASREIDRLAFEEFAMPTIVLMENAAAALEAEARSMLCGQARGAEVVIVCGPGNNGGDGYALARRVSNAGARARLVAVGDPARLAGDARTNAEIARRMGLDVRRWSGVRGEGWASGASLVVDAIFGTGLDREVTGESARAIEAINALGSRGVGVLAADVPSGLDADTGRVLGTCVRAHATVTFAGLKPGLLRLEAEPYAGRVSVADVGHPRSLVERVGDRAWAEAPARRAAAGPVARPKAPPRPGG